jgi:hypothetical protein
MELDLDFPMDFGPKFHWIQLDWILVDMDIN